MDPDRDLRHRAWQAELGAWEAHALPIAACAQRRQGSGPHARRQTDWADPLDESLFWSAIDRDILDVMVEEARAAFPDFRRYLRLKARLLGTPELAWYDLFAPVGDAGRVVDLAGSDRIHRGAVRRVQRPAGEDWRGAPSRRTGSTPARVQARSAARTACGCSAIESRILANYSPGYDGVTTLAHELGHAYHNLNEAGLTPLQRRTPMILAETASTFCETLVKEAALVDAEPGERIYILEQSVPGACQVVVDILSRFDFEQALFAGRRERELSIGELNRLMLAAQEATYGDGAGQRGAAPLHVGGQGALLQPGPLLLQLSLSLRAALRAGSVRDLSAGAGRVSGSLRRALASTGRASAGRLWPQDSISTCGDAGFWRSSLAVIRDDIDRLEELAGASERRGR